MPFRMLDENDGSKRLPCGTTFHLLPEEVWSQFQVRHEYVPETYEEDGFVHCTNGEVRLLETGNRYYRGDPQPFLLLEIDLDRLDAPILYADNERRYPHVHGPIARDAILSVRRLQRNETGEFLAIADPFD